MYKYIISECILIVIVFLLKIKSNYLISERLQNFIILMTDILIQKHTVSKE